MKRVFLIGSLALVLFTNTACGQDVSQSQVPSVIVSSFQKEFPKAIDAEWEKEGVNYKVEFETGATKIDHDVWYDSTGKLIRHKEEIAQTELPQKVSEKIKNSFNGYRLKDVKRITEGNKISYKMELKSATEEWKVVFDSEGNVLSKIAD